jgi:hypothetical protein
VLAGARPGEPEGPEITPPKHALETSRIGAA